MSSVKALFRRYPWRIDIPILLVASIVLLIAGLSRPVFGVKKLVFWHDQYTIISGVINLYRDGQALIASIIFFFSIIFPLTKLTTLIIVWFFPIASSIRKKILHWLEILGHWSMLDVFVVAIIVVIAKSTWLSDANPKPGLYFFGASVILSMIVAFMINQISNKK